jgi:hypothetical protein
MDKERFQLAVYKTDLDIPNSINFDIIRQGNCNYTLRFRNVRLTDIRNFISSVDKGKNVSFNTNVPIGHHDITYIINYSDQDYTYIFSHQPGFSTILNTELTYIFIEKLKRILQDKGIKI